MAKKYLDNDGLIYLWQKIKSYFTGTAVPNMDGTAATGSSQKFAREDHVHPVDTSRAPTSHASTATTYGKGTSSNYGHVKLSDSTTATTAAASGGTAATPKAVSDALAAAKSYTDTEIAGIDAGVVSVNGQTGAVVLDATDIGYSSSYAEADVSTVITNIMDDLVNKVDAETGKGLSTNDYTTAEKTKLAGIETGAEANIIESVEVNGVTLTPDAAKKVSITSVESINNLSGKVDFDFAFEHYRGSISGFSLAEDTTEELYLITEFTDGDENIQYVCKEVPVATTSENGIMSAADKTKLNGVATGAEVNVQADWNESDSTSDAYIQNKPTIPTVGNAKVFYGTCSTSASTATKDVIVSDFPSSLTYLTGAILFVKFTYGNSANNVILKINGSTATQLNVTIQSSDSSTPSTTELATAYYWSPLEIVPFCFDGTCWTLANNGKASTAYYGITKLSSAIDSSSTNLAATPSAVKAAYDLAASKASTSVATTSTNGLMSSTDKTKLDKLIFDTNDLIDSSILPSYVDDVIEAYPRSGQTELSSTWLATGSASGTVITPEAGKIYVLMADTTNYTTNTQFRWGGSAYVKLNDGGVSEITNAEIDTIMAS